MGNTNKSKNAPIKWFGGKSLMFNNILKYFPPHSSYNVYIEPFAGSFVMALKKEPTTTEIYNDLNKDIYSLYKVISDKDLFHQFKEKCDLLYYSEAIHDEYVEKLKEENLSLLDRAFYFFVVNRTSRSGNEAFGTALCPRRGMSKSVSDFLSAIDRLPELHQRLSRLICYNRDGIKLITKYDWGNVFIYADPPYDHSTRGTARYKIDMDRDKHLEFIDIALNLKKAKILISGYDCEIYDKLVNNGFEKINFKVNTVNGENKPKIKTETLWRNYSQSYFNT